MNKPDFISPTIAYYDQNAAPFSSSTEGVDMSHLYAEFLPMIPQGGRILDAGCGAGRDTAYFKSLGYNVSAFDASRELAAIATEKIGIPVEVMTFQDVEAVDEFDGVWACASLLHIANAEMCDALHRLSRALKVGGALYVSFKHGSRERQHGGRFFNDFDEAKLKSVLQKHPELSIQKLWLSSDARPGREQEQWLNAILLKT
jgi:SAM-dependent methyltransferase